MGIDSPYFPYEDLAERYPKDLSTGLPSIPESLGTDLYWRISNSGRYIQLDLMARRKWRRDKSLGNDWTIKKNYNQIQFYLEALRMLKRLENNLKPTPELPVFGNYPPNKLE